MTTYTIANENDYNEINSFYNKFRNLNRTFEQFTWEFIDNPAGKAIYIIAKDNDKIIGTQCAIPVYFSLPNGEIILTGKSEDTLVDPEYRGKNILSNMYELLFSECTKMRIDIIWGFTLLNKTFQKLGFEIPLSYTQTVLVLKPFKSFKSFNKQRKTDSSLDKLKIFILCYGLKLKRIVKINTRELGDFNVVENGDFNTDVLLSKIRKSYLLSSISHSQEYLKWRVNHNPFYHETICYSLLDEQRNVRANIILNINSDNSCYIIDFLFDPEIKLSVLTTFINYITNKLSKKGVALIRNWNFSHNEYGTNELSVFLKSGFFHIKKGSFFVWKNLSGLEIYPKNLLLTRIASEGTI